MEEKRFGVKVSLINELKRFQLALRKKKRNIAFIAELLVSFNNDTPYHEWVQVTTRTVSVGQIIHSFKVPRQILGETNDTTVTIRLTSN